MMTPARVIAIVQNRLLRKGIGIVVEAEPDMEFACGEDMDSAADLLRWCGAEVVLIDIDWPADKGLDAIRRIRQQDDNVWIIGLATYDGDENCKLALTAGTDTILSKDLIATMLIPLIRSGRPERPRVYQSPNVVEL